MTAVIDTGLVCRLVRSQFPAWADLEVRRVPIDGWDNRTFRLGADLSVRLPSGPGYESQVRKEIAVLPRLAASLSIPVPEVVGVGTAGDGYPYEWTVRRWIDGVPLRDAADPDGRALAVAVGAFLAELRTLPTDDGPSAGEHSQGRGAPLAQFDEEVHAELARRDPRIDAERAAFLWHDALEAADTEPTRWLHGDVAIGNLLTRDGILSAVIDWGCCAVGDPACDLAFGWNVLDGDDRAVFRAAVDVSDAEWARGIGWVLWKGLVSKDDPAPAADEARRGLAQIGVFSS